MKLINKFNFFGFKGITLLIYMFVFLMHESLSLTMKSKETSASSLTKESNLNQAGVEMQTELLLNSLSQTSEQMEAYNGKTKKHKKKFKATVTKHKTEIKNKAQVKALNRVSAPAAPAAAGATGNASNGSNGTNQTIRNVSSNLYTALNKTFVKHELNQFKRRFSSYFDYKMVPKQLEEIFRTIKMYDSRYETERGDRAYMEIFVKEFEKCDADNSRDLNMTEFVKCMENDPYLRDVTPPPANFASRPELTQSKVFYTEIFNSIDIYNTTFVNFQSYMDLRLIIFSWKHCSVVAPFIDELGWECTIPIVSGMKTPDRKTLRNTFYMALELSGGAHLRNMDFISYLYFAQGMRCYSKINSKIDGDITINEFNLALDDNSLPKRYNSDLVKTFFRITEDKNNPNASIDVRTFIYYDFVFRIFDKFANSVPWRLTVNEFIAVVESDLFPLKIYSSLYKIPEVNYTSVKESEAYQFINITNFHSEQDFLMKFLEKSQKTVSKSKSKANSKSLQAGAAATPSIYATDKKRLNHIMELATPQANRNFTSTLEKIFRILDVNSDGVIDYYDFGMFMETGYLFAKTDVEERGSIMAGKLSESFSHWSDYPFVSDTFRERSRRFTDIHVDSYVDMFEALTVLRIDDIVQLYTRMTDPTILFEVELKRVFYKCDLAHINNRHLDNCIKGIDPKKHLAQYDWQCAFMDAVKANIELTETLTSYNTQKAYNLDVVNTVFHNIDPALQNATFSTPPI